MTRTSLFAGAARWALLIGLAALPLTACKPAASPGDASSAPSSALPLAASGAPVTPAPPVADLPPAPPVPVGHLRNRSDYYAFADHAYAVNQAFGDAPPDYQYDYNGAEPWVWRSDNGAMRVAEALPGGGDRYYYYEPGSDYPYLVRDPQYSYGYDNGELVVIYDSGGRPLPDNEFQARQDYASRFYARGRSLYAGSQQQQHQAVVQSNWMQRRNEYAAEQQRWAQDQRADADWQAYHQAHDQQEQDQWAAERARRENEAVVFDVTINDTQAAARDRQAAQLAQQHAQSAPPPPQGGIFHFGQPHDQGPPPAVAPAGGGEPPHQGPAAGPVVLAPAGGPPMGDNHHQDHRDQGAAGQSTVPSAGPGPDSHRQDHFGPGAGAPQGGQPSHREGVTPQGHAVVEAHQPPPESHGGGLAGAIANHVAAEHPTTAQVHVVTPVVKPVVKPTPTPKPPVLHPQGDHGPDDHRDHHEPPNGQ